MGCLACVLCGGTTVLVRTTVEVGAVSAATLFPSFRNMQETVGVVENSFREMLFRIAGQINFDGEVTNGCVQ